MLAFSNNHYGLDFGVEQSVELFCAYEATKKWTMPIRNWGQVYGELSIMYEGRLPE